LSAASSELSQANDKTTELEDKTRLGWDPTYWFSGTRSQAKSRLADHHQALVQLEKQYTNLRRRLSGAKTKLNELEAEVQKYDGFDRGAAQVDLARLDAEIPLRELERDDLAVRKAEVDRQLKAPLKELKRLKSELDDLEDEVRALERELNELEDEKAGAERLDGQISRAATSYDRAMLHQECERRFGDSSPRGVARDRRHAINRTRGALQSKHRQVAAVQRNIAKVEARIELSAERALRTIRALIIDGNNLCYEGRQFIGLAALKPLCRRLSESYDVTVVFDASIRSALRANDNDLRRELHGTKVHVVASRGKADETVLHAAQDAYVYVLSNDRYAEYREKPVVKNNRLIRHEILNGRVLVHDLAVDEPFFARS
jgi:hypothetical protein